MTVHGMRHTCASYLWAEGVPVKVIQERLGHSSVQVTLDIYTHLKKGDDRQAAAVSANLLLGELADQP